MLIIVLSILSYIVTVVFFLVLAVEKAIRCGCFDEFLIKLSFDVSVIYLLNFSE